MRRLCLRGVRTLGVQPAPAWLPSVSFLCWLVPADPRPAAASLCHRTSSYSKLHAHVCNSQTHQGGAALLQAPATAPGPPCLRGACARAPWARPAGASAPPPADRRLGLSAPETGEDEGKSEGGSLAWVARRVHQAASWAGRGSGALLVVQREGTCSSRLFYATPSQRRRHSPASSLPTSGTCPPDQRPCRAGMSPCAPASPPGSPLRQLAPEMGRRGSSWGVGIRGVQSRQGSQEAA